MVFLCSCVLFLCSWVVFLCAVPICSYGVFLCSFVVFLCSCVMFLCSLWCSCVVLLVGVPWWCSGLPAWCSCVLFLCSCVSVGAFTIQCGQSVFVLLWSWPSSGVLPEVHCTNIISFLQTTWCPAVSHYAAAVSPSCLYQCTVFCGAQFCFVWVILVFSQPIRILQTRIICILPLWQVQCYSFARIIIWAWFFCGSMIGISLFPQSLWPRSPPLVLI